MALQTKANRCKGECQLWTKQLRKLSIIPQRNIWMRLINTGGLLTICPLGNCTWRTIRYWSDPWRQLMSKFIRLGIGAPLQVRISFMLIWTGSSINTTWICFTLKVRDMAAKSWSLILILMAVIQSSIQKFLKMSKDCNVYSNNFHSRVVLRLTPIPRRLDQFMKAVNWAIPSFMALVPFLIIRISLPQLLLVMVNLKQVHLPPLGK